MSGNPNVIRLAPCITCHAWNGDKTKIAICPNNNEVHIYTKKGDAWVLEFQLKQHDAVVTSLDWAPTLNRIVSCSQDRNAYVWAFENGKWEPTLVILRINRAATFVKWSPKEDKFAVASGAKVVSVCHFEEENNWWVSKHIKKHRSTVTKVAWHPNNQLLATGCTDFKCRIFSAAIKIIDKRPASSAWAAKTPIFGEVVLEVECPGWVHGVAFSPSGDRLAFVGHDSSVTFVDPGQPPTTIKLPGLPQMDLMFADENRVITVGHDCQPILFTSTGPCQWAFAQKLDEKKATTGAAGGATGGANAFELFKNKVDRGTTDSGSLQTVLETKHQNTITAIVPYTIDANKAVTEFSTCGLDGSVVVWKI